MDNLLTLNLKLDRRDRESDEKSLHWLQSESPKSSDVVPAGVRSHSKSCRDRKMHLGVENYMAKSRAESFVLGY